MLAMNDRGLGIVGEGGSAVRQLTVGDAVLVPFNIFLWQLLLLPTRALQQLSQRQPRSHRPRGASLTWVPT